MGADSAAQAASHGAAPRKWWQDQYGLPVARLILLDGHARWRVAQVRAEALPLLIARHPQGMRSRLFTLFLVACGVDTEAKLLQLYPAGITISLNLSCLDADDFVVERPTGVYDITALGRLALDGLDIETGKRHIAGLP